METTTNSAKVVSSKEGTKFNILGHEVTVKLHSWDGNDNYVFGMISPPNSGIPPHVHKNEDEVVYILEGQFEVMVGGEVFQATSGDCLNFVRNIPHGYANTGTTDAKSQRTERKFFWRNKTEQSGTVEMARDFKRRS